MPITVNPSDKPLEAIKTRYITPELADHYVKNPFDIVERDRDLQKKKGEILQCSFPMPTNASSESDLIIPAEHSNGFVGTALQAYNKHHHLVIRPDDVWIAILTQFNSFVNANAETLRHLFVAHEDQKMLTILTQENPLTADFGNFATQMGKLIQENVVDPRLREWIMPDFSTTTADDKIISSVIMMSTLKKYFGYAMVKKCGLPAVTLLGEKGDWENMLQRIERLTEYGEATAQWRDLLRPVLSGFVETFNNPNGVETKDFWQNIADYRPGGSGPTYLSGWITAFCFFDSKGVSLYSHEEKGWQQGKGMLTLGGTIFHHVKTSEIPVGYADVPVTLKDNCTEVKTVMVAGLVGTRVSGNSDTVQPQSAWWIAVDKSEQLED
ncbi:hypothetical protein BGX26_008129 [Mortierella sp. AD094]|nr:hypothetical protein BGX26_008129 [Mortierella sp. AD094]